MVFVFMMFPILPASAFAVEEEGLDLPTLAEPEEILTPDEPVLEEPEVGQPEEAVGEEPLIEEPVMEKLEGKIINAKLAM